MKKLLISAVLMLMVVLSIKAEEQQKFSPEKFQAALEQHITNEAGLTPEEAAKFFPLYREMQQKQRAVYNKMPFLPPEKQPPPSWPEVLVSQ